MKYVVTDEAVERAHTIYWSTPEVKGCDRKAIRAALESFAQTLGEPVAVHQAVFTGTLDGRHVGLHGSLESVAVLQSYVERHDKDGEPVYVPDDSMFEVFAKHFGANLDPYPSGINNDRELRYKYQHANELYASFQHMRKVMLAAPHHPTTEKGCE